MSGSDDDIDDLLLGTVGKSSKKADVAKKRARDFSPSDDSEASSEASGHVFVHPYPLEGQYKDKADREEILAMSEIERETILYDRSKEVDQMREKERLAARLKQRNVQAASDAKNVAARRSERDAAPQKLSALQELKRKREAKSNKSASRQDESATKRSKRDYYSSDDDDEGVVSSEEDVDSPATRRAEDRERMQREREAEDVEGSKPISFTDALQIRMTRKSCVKYLYYPQFPETSVSCFVRISIKSNDGKPKYRLCQVSRMLDCPATYKLPTGEPCKSAFECAHGANKKAFDLTYISDSVFTEEEFDTWRETMRKDNLQLMNRRRLKSKVESLKEMGDHRLTDSEINVMIERKRDLSKIPRNVAAEKIRLTGLIAEARENGKNEDVEKYQNELAKMEELTANRGRNGDLDRLSKLNERNRQQNLKVIGKAEVDNINKRAQAELLGKSGGDPFSRLKTKPRTFYESTPNSSAPGSPSIVALISGNDLPQREPGSATKIKRTGGVDGLIGDIDIDLDL